MDRRKFALSMAALATPHAAQTVQTGNSSSSYRTLSFIGKEEQPFRNKKEATLAEHDGTGYLGHMWFGGDFPDYAKVRIRIYIDRESTPSINMQLGMGSGFGFQDPAAPWGTKYSGKTGSPSGIFNFYRIPFSAHVRVTAQLPEGAADDQVFWWIVRGYQGLPLQVSGIQLPPSAKLKLYTRENFAQQPLDEFDLCKTDQAGMVFQVAIAAKSGNFNFLEAMMRAYIDGAEQPQLLSSGLEDYFLGTYYFNRGLYHLEQAGLTHKDDSDYSFSAYRFHDEDPIFFSKGLRLTCRCGERIREKTFGHPKPTTYTTYAWLYEW